MKQFNIIPDKVLSFPIKKPVKKSPYLYMYKKTIWQKLRAAKLEKNPLCEYCIDNGQISIGHAIDHIQPHRGNWKKFLSFKNLRTLCKSCHCRKSQRERGSYGHNN